MKPLSIIVADDVLEIQSLVAQWLRPHGHKVACASSGTETLKLLGDDSFDLVILDVLMPDGDGIDVIREVRDKGKSARILAISGGGRYMQAADCVKIASEMGAHAALLKPFDERQLLAGIERAIRA